MNVYADLYYTRPEARRIAGDKSDVTLWRWEKAGIFPRRTKLGPNSIGYKKSSIDDWVKDPQAWVENNRPEQAA